MHENKHTPNHLQNFKDGCRLQRDIESNGPDDEDGMDDEEKEQGSKKSI
jgi:hypothetical protein